jgi:hypothetical protein
MYKGASQSLQRRHAVDKPHPSRGYIDGGSDTRDVLPSPESMTTSQLKSEQAQLRLEMQKIEQELTIAKALGNNRAADAIGQRKMMHQTRLSAVNVTLRERNRGSDEAILSQAIRDVCDDETVTAIFARCRELRASGMSAFGQDPQGLEAKTASPTGEAGDAPDIHP